MENRGEGNRVTVTTGNHGILGRLVGYHLRRAYGAFAVDFARALAGTDIRQPLFGIIAIVAEHPDINQGEVGRRLGIQRANMVSLMNELVDLGLVERRTVNDDKRSFALRLTPAGRTTLDDCHARIRAHEDEMLCDLSEAERTILIALLERIEARER